MNGVPQFLRANNDQWNKKIFIVLAVVYSALIADVSIANIADFPSVISFATSIWGITLFVSIVVVAVVGLYLIPRYLKIPHEGERFLHPKIRFGYIVYAIQYILAATIIVITLQILFFSSYFTFELMVVVPLSYGLAAFLMGVLCSRLFIWFRYNKSVITLIFAITALLITVNAVASLIYFEERLTAKPSTLITSDSEVVYDVGFEPGTFMFVVARLQVYSMVGYFVSSWAGTILLLIHHRKRVGNLKFSTLVVLPIIFLMYFFIRLFPLTNPDSPITIAFTSFNMESFLFYTYAIALLGILIGIGFYSVSRAVKQNIDIRNYMLITAYGFVLFFNAADATVIQTGYPPFGLPNVSFVGLSSFLIFIGLYSSAISVSRDVQLRRFIKKTVVDEAKFLASIGTAQMQQETENKIIIIAKNKMVESAENSQIPPSLTDEEIRSYIEEVIEEVKLRKPSIESD
jgi:hypothetical protein